ncbi:MAG: helix-turn-helix domain-containing protein [Polyangiaceae bacterium]
MAEEAYTTLGGEVVSYPALRQDVAAMLAVLREMATDGRVDDERYGQMIVFVRDHPEVPAALSPVLDDLLARRASSATLDVTQAAERLGVHPSRVRQAAAAGQLPGRKVGRWWMFSPSDVEAFDDARGPRRGPRAGEACPLEVVIAREPGGSLRIKAVDVETVDKSPVVRLRVTSWQRAAVIFGPKGSLRMFELVPGGLGDEIGWGNSYVRGRFVVDRKHNNPKDASRAWRSFEPT